MGTEQEINERFLGWAERSDELRTQFGATRYLSRKSDWGMVGNSRC